MADRFLTDTLRRYEAHHAEVEGWNAYLASLDAVADSPEPRAGRPVTLREARQRALRVLAETDEELADERAEEARLDLSDAEFDAVLSRIYTAGDAEC